MGKGMPSRHPLILWKTGENKENIEMEKKRLFLSGLLLLILAFASFSENMDTPSEESRALKKSDSLKKNWAFFSVGIIIEV